jgi:hypothetical protein
VINNNDPSTHHHIGRGFRADARELIFFSIDNLLFLECFSLFMETMNKKGEISPLNLLLTAACIFIALGFLLPNPLDWLGWLGGALMFVWGICMMANIATG